MKSFRIDDCEVEADVWELWVPPSVHVDPWSHELVRCECRDDPLSLRLEPCFTTSIVDDVAPLSHRAASLGLLR